MKSKILVTAILFASIARAKEPKVHQTGTLLQMDSAECGVDENSGKSVMGELVGTDSARFLVYQDDRELENPSADLATARQCPLFAV